MPSYGCHLPNSLWAGIIKLFPARESLVSGILSGDGNVANLFIQCRPDKINGNPHIEKKPFCLEIILKEVRGCVILCLRRYPKYPPLGRSSWWCPSSWSPSSWSPGSCLSSPSPEPTYTLKGQCHEIFVFFLNQFSPSP